MYNLRLKKFMHLLMKELTRAVDEIEYKNPPEVALQILQQRMYIEDAFIEAVRSFVAWNYKITPYDFSKFLKRKGLKFSTEFLVIYERTFEQWDKVRRRYKPPTKCEDEPQQSSLNNGSRCTEGGL